MKKSETEQSKWKLNREDEQGWSLARRCIEQALTRVIENGEPGLDIQEVNDE